MICIGGCVKEWSALEDEGVSCIGGCGRGGLYWRMMVKVVSLDERGSETGSVWRDERGVICIGG